MDKLAFAERMRTAPTVSEGVFWDAVKGGQMATGFRGEPAIRVNRQQVIRGFIADFYLPRYRAIIEIDGGSHQSEAQTLRDHRRDELFTDWSYSVFRISAALVMRDVDLVRELVKEFVAELAEGDLRHSHRLWRFGGYGILRRGYYGLVTEREHWFRITPELPADVVCTISGEMGDTDMHELVECRASRCREWAA